MAVKSAAQAGGEAPTGSGGCGDGAWMRDMKNPLEGMAFGRRGSIARLGWITAHTAVLTRRWLRRCRCGIAGLAAPFGLFQYKLINQLEHKYGTVQYTTQNEQQQVPASDKFLIFPFFWGGHRVHSCIVPYALM